MNTLEEDIAVKGKTKRILAFDLIRGFFLLVIMVDHIELYPNGWDMFTGKGRLWVSAAEGFFFMSGLLVGMIYRRRLALGMKFIFKKMWKRAAELYLVGTGMTFFYLGWVQLSNHAPIKDSLPSPLPWHHLIEQALMMRFTYGWADFLVRFALLMFIAPFFFYLIAKGKWWLAAALSIAAWVFRGEGFTLAWQVIFNAGILIGFYWNELRRRFANTPRPRRSLIKKAVASAAAVTFLISYASVYILSLLNYLYGNLTSWLRHVTFTWNNYNADIWVYAQKWTMGPVRIVLFFLWFATLYLIVRRYETTIARYSRGLLELLGRNSLFVYAAHSVIVFAFKMYLTPSNTNPLQNFAITSAAIFLLIVITIFYKRFEPAITAFFARRPRNLPRKLASLKF